MAKNIVISKERYIEVVLKVEEDDEHGRPKIVQIVRDDDRVNLKGGERFLTAFIHEAANLKRAKA